MSFCGLPETYDETPSFPSFVPWIDTLFASLPDEPNDLNLDTLELLLAGCPIEPAQQQEAAEPASLPAYYSTVSFSPEPSYRQYEEEETAEEEEEQLTAAPSPMSASSSSANSSLHTRRGAVAKPSRRTLSPRTSLDVDVRRIQDDTLIPVTILKRNIEDFHTFCQRYALPAWLVSKMTDARRRRNNRRYQRITRNRKSGNKAPVESDDEDDGDQASDDQAYNELMENFVHA